MHYDIVTKQRRTPSTHHESAGCLARYEVFGLSVSSEKLKAVKGDHDVLHFTFDAYIHNFTFDLSPCCQQEQQTLQVR